ncbi:tRNA (adenosine(37)-N6)-threonylcarbamoyltransferase complex dimerization subunit type 1 TsaB [Synechococcus elongatus IITB7]|uniref:tRNA (adenosine(37)-N6)-threonylcarbamoyltransferase complex dimerization subunit type 1 TsaB n=1 Tax=Synechococcus elongatus TaxID=32046 RepID=UPI0030D2CD7C
MLGLAIHTSTPTLGLAISTSSDLPFGQTWDVGRDTAAVLLPRLQEFISPRAWTELNFLAVACGPGGFTGTRIGVVTARTLAQQLELPLFGLSTLAGLAATQWRQTGQPQPIAVSMEAQRGQLIGALYDCQDGIPVALETEQVYEPEAWAQKLADWQLMDCRADETIATTVTDLLAIAERQWQRGDRPDWSAALPYYGQHPVSVAAG